MRMRLWLPIALIVCVVGYLVIRLEQSAMPVKTAVVERANIISTESTNGKVEPTEDFQAHAPVAGVVQKIWVDPGAEGAGRSAAGEDGCQRGEEEPGGLQRRACRRREPRCRICRLADRRMSV